MLGRRVLVHEGLGILVDRRDPRDVRGFEDGEGDGQSMPPLDGCGSAEVSQPLPLLFAHVIAVGDVRLGDGGVPLGTADAAASDGCHRIADLVVVSDRVFRLVACVAFATGPFPTSSSAG